MIILGIDPGTATTGYGVVSFNAGRQGKPLAYGTIETPAKTPLPDRLNHIFTKVTDLIDEYQPDAVSVEQLFFSRNRTTAFAVGQARGVILLAAARARLNVFEYTPQQVKQAVVGQGNATKDQVGYMVKLLLALREQPKPDDAADALAIAICHGNHQEGVMRRQAAMKHQLS